MIGKFLTGAVLVFLLGVFPAIADTSPGTSQAPALEALLQLAQADAGKCYKECILYEGEDKKNTCKLRCGRKAAEGAGPAKDCIKIYKSCNSACKKDKKCKKACRQARLSCQ